MPFHLLQYCSHFGCPDAICWSFLNLSRYLMVLFILFIHQFFVSPCSPSTSLIPLSCTITFPDALFIQFNPIISCFLTICFAIRKISFWHSKSFELFAHTFCFFSFAEEITLFAFFLLFLYSILASFVFSFFHFLYVIFFSLTALATSSFHYHVSLCLCGPVVIPHMSWADSIIIPFIGCQWSFTHRPFQFVSSTLSLTMHLYGVCPLRSLVTLVLSHFGLFLRTELTEDRSD